MGVSNTENTRQYFNVREGKIFTGKGDNEKTYDTIDGCLKSLSIFDKDIPGHGNKEVLRIVLVDGEDELHIETGASSTFARMFAGYLHAISQNEHIRIRVKQNDRNEKVTSCFVESLHADGWKKVEYRSLKQEAGEALAAAFEIIHNHPAYEAYEPRQRDNGAQGTGSAASEKARFLSVLALYRMPSYAIHKDVYEVILRAILKQPDLTIDNANEDQWAALADYLMKKDTKDSWPKPLKDADADEYDPFADN